MPPVESPPVVESTLPAAASVPEPEVFGALGPVLVGAFLLWLVVIAVVGSSV